jgi:hypothetical protein
MTLKDNRPCNGYRRRKSVRSLAVFGDGLYLFSGNPAVLYRDREPALRQPPFSRSRRPRNARRFPPASRPSHSATWRFPSASSGLFAHVATTALSESCQLGAKDDMRQQFRTSGSLDLDALENNLRYCAKYQRSCPSYSWLRKSLFSRRIG